MDEAFKNAVLQPFIDYGRACCLVEKNKAHFAPFTNQCGSDNGCLQSPSTADTSAGKEAGIAGLVVVGVPDPNLGPTTPATTESTTTTTPKPVDRVEATITGNNSVKRWYAKAKIWVAFGIIGVVVVGIIGLYCIRWND